jgi:hypothetical protein
MFVWYFTRKTGQVGVGGGGGEKEGRGGGRERCSMSKVGATPVRGGVPIKRVGLIVLTNTPNDKK